MSRRIAQSIGRIVRELYGIIYLNRVGGKYEFAEDVIFVKSKKRLCIIAVIGCLIIIAISVFFYKNTAVSKKIIKDCNKPEQNNLEIVISDYTNFDWDTLIIYKTPVSKKELFETTGLDYEKELDLKSGMIFIKDNQIVYDESFETDFESPLKLNVMMNDSGVKALSYDLLEEYALPEEFQSQFKVISYYEDLSFQKDENISVNYMTESEEDYDEYSESHIYISIETDKN